MVGEEEVESNITLVITSSFKAQRQKIFFKAHEVSKTGIHILKDTDMKITSSKIRQQEGGRSPFALRLVVNAV